MHLFYTVEGLPGLGKEALWLKLMEFGERSEKKPHFCKNIYPSGRSLNVFSDLLHLTAARLDLITEEIQPKLDEFKEVYCQDFLATDYASTHFLRGQGASWGADETPTIRDEFFDSVDVNFWHLYVPRSFFELHDRFCHALYPDITFFVNTSPEESLSHLSRTGCAIFGSNASETLESLYKGYLDFGEMCQKFENKVDTPYFMGATEWIEIDPLDPIESAHEKLSKLGVSLFPELGRRDATDGSK